MNRWVKIVGGILLAVLAFIVVVGVIAYGVTQGWINEEYDINVEALTIPEEESALERGEYLARAVGACIDCHEFDLGGGEVFSAGPIGRVYAPNLTPGEGSVTGEYTDTDWIRSIRHGVGPDNKGLIIMPSEDFLNMTDEDLSALIAYLKALDPVDRESESSRLLLIRLFWMIGDDTELISAREIDHVQETPQRVEIEVSAEYGEYLAQISCAGCHGTDMTGGLDATMSGVLSANLTSEGVLSEYNLGAFATALERGIKANGDAMDPDIMPWLTFANLTADDVEAIWLYLNSLPA